MVTCRCRQLNVITGDAARDYAEEHLEVTRSDGHGHDYYRCEQSGVGWVQERPRGPFSGEPLQLRRTDRA